MNKINYQLKLDSTIESIKKENVTPVLLLHSCCAPCSSYVLEYLSEYFSITVLYFNPNIFPLEEYEYRIEEQKRLIKELPVKNKISLLATDYEPDRFYSCVKGYEHIPETGERCYRCYRLRLEEAAIYAQRINADYFTTTLSISPMKDSQKLNEIGLELQNQYSINYLFSDFKKRNGYKRSVELSKEYSLYRQDYCGCIFSKKECEVNIK